MKMEIIKVSNGNNKFPRNFTLEERHIIQSNLKGKVLHLFSGKSIIGDVRIDLAQPEATHNINVFDFLNSNTEYFDTVILDPPYNQKFADKYDKLSGNKGNQLIIFASVEKTSELFKMITAMKPKYIIIKSWNYYVPKGYVDAGSYLCYAGGYRKSTILMICKKKED
jgi:hypothetical protein